MAPDLLTCGYGAASVVGLYAVYSLVSKWRTKRAFSKYTAVDELSIIGKQREDGARIRGSAVIIGGSMAGMFTALACASHFEKVIVLEADEGADERSPTIGVRDTPAGLRAYKTRRTRLEQTYALHVYQPYTLYALRRWFPNWDEEVKAAGGRINRLSPLPWYSNLVIGNLDPLYPGGKWLPRHPNVPADLAPEWMWVCRETLEPLLRRMIAKHYPNVQLIHGTANKLAVNEGKTKVASVVYTCKADSVTHHLTPALLCDCTGSSMAGIKWLTKAGLPSPNVISYQSDLSYGSVIFETPPSIQDRLPLPGGGYKNTEFWCNVAFNDFGRTGIVVCKFDHDRLAIGFAGWGVTDTPRSPEELKDWHRNVALPPNSNTKPVEWMPELIDILCENDGWDKALIEAVHYEGSALAEYHKYKELPENFIAIGDSTMNTSPIYGLGISKGCVGAATLEGMLWKIGNERKALPETFAKAFMNLQWLRTEWAWTSSKEHDYLYETTTPAKGETKQPNFFQRNLLWPLFIVFNKNPDLGALAQHERLWLYPPETGVSVAMIAKAVWYWLAGYKAFP